MSNNHIFNNSNLVFQNSRSYNRDINHLFERYLKATEEDHENGHLRDEEHETLTPLPHQEHSDQSNDSIATSTNNTENKEKEEENTKNIGDKNTDIETSPAKAAGKPYDIPASLRKPFKIPFKDSLVIVTPHQKEASRSGSSIKFNLGTNTMKDTNTAPNLKDNYKANDNVANENSDVPPRELHKESNGNALFDEMPTPKKPPAYDFSKCYTSPFLSNTFKPTKDSLKLTPELELLEPLILSQHGVFTQPIIDLGTIILNSAKALTKKQESLKLLQSDNKIPRSLRIKCELTTSPDFADHPGFLRFKNQLQQEVAGFIARGTKIMIGWTELHTQLLNLDRCASILGKALQILEGLTYLFTNIFGTPLWPSVEDKLIPLFLFKYYILSPYIDTTEVTDFLGLPPEDLLLLGAKLLTSTQTDQDASAIITSLKLSDIDLDEEVDEAFVSEILSGFDQILRFATIGIWHCYHDIARQTVTAVKLKAKMQSLEITKATAATAQAIAKATSNLESNQKLTANTNLRISNLEKSMARQEEKANEIINRLKSSNQQKNSKGSHLLESMASPEKMTPSRNAIQNTKQDTPKRTIVDLTLETLENHTTEGKALSSSPPYHKKQKHRQQRTNPPQKNQRTPTKKSVQWKDIAQQPQTQKDILQPPPQPSLLKPPQTHSTINSRFSIDPATQHQKMPQNPFTLTEQLLQPSHFPAIQTLQSHPLYLQNPSHYHIQPNLLSTQQAYQQYPNFYPPQNPPVTQQAPTLTPFIQSIYTPNNAPPNNSFPYHPFHQQN